MMPRGAPLGKWWKNSALVKELGVSDAQVEQIERIFQDHRLKLIDLRAALEKNEALLEPLIEVDHPDEAKVVAQIDKVAQSRAELEKSNAQMLLAIRRVLTVDQWKKLQEHSRRMERFPRPGQPQPQGPPPRPGA
jgi:Spy/CpxP family protein refolding chaperone